MMNGKRVTTFAMLQRDKRIQKEESRPNGRRRLLAFLNVEAERKKTNTPSTSLKGKGKTNLNQKREEKKRFY